MKIDDVFVHPTFASFMRAGDPKCDISEESQCLAKASLGWHEAGFFVQHDTLHLWFDQDVSLECLAGTLERGLWKLRNNAPAPSGTVTKNTVLLIDRLKKVGRLQTALGLS